MVKHTMFQKGYSTNKAGEVRLYKAPCDGTFGLVEYYDFIRYDTDDTLNKQIRIVVEEAKNNYKNNIK